MLPLTPNIRKGKPYKRHVLGRTAKQAAVSPRPWVDSGRSFVVHVPYAGRACRVRCTPQTCCTYNKLVYNRVENWEPAARLTRDQQSLKWLHENFTACNQDGTGLETFRLDWWEF